MAPPALEEGDKWVMSKFRWTTILRPFFDIFERLLETQNFLLLKITPLHWGEGPFNAGG